MMSSPRPCTTVCKLVSGGPTTELLLNTFHLTRPCSLVSLMSRTYICMGLQFMLWYSGLPTFSDCGGWCPRRRAMGGSECPSPWAVPGRAEPGSAPGDPGDDTRGGLSMAEAEVALEERALTASRLRRSALGDTAPGRVPVAWGGVWMPLVCSGGFRAPAVLPSTLSSWHRRDVGFCSQPSSTEARRRSLCSGSEPRRGVRAGPTLRSNPSVAEGVLGDRACTGLSREAPPAGAAPGDTVPPLSTGELSPLAGDRLPSREPDGVCLRGRRVPQRPLTQGASSMFLTGDWERNSRVSGTRAGGVALMGDGRELRLGLSGALPLGAWLKTTTHCPTCGESGEQTSGGHFVLGRRSIYGAFWEGIKRVGIKREWGPCCVHTLHAGWHHSSGAPWSSFSTLSGCHVQGLACMWSNQASLKSWGGKGDRFRSPG